MTAKTTETSKAWREYSKAKVKYNKKRDRINKKLNHQMKLAQSNANMALSKLEEDEIKATDKIADKYHIR